MTKHSDEHDELRRVAWHEAGHVLMTTSLLGNVNRVTIVPGDTYHGRTWSSAGTASAKVIESFVARNDPYYRWLAEVNAASLIHVLIAGQAGEAVLTGRHRLYMDRDMEEIDEVTYILNPKPAGSSERQRYNFHIISPAYTRVRTWLKRHHAQLQAVADALLVHRTLDGEQLDGVLDAYPLLRRPRWANVSPPPESPTISTP